MKHAWGIALRQLFAATAAAAGSSASSLAPSLVQALAPNYYVNKHFITIRIEILDDVLQVQGRDQDDEWLQQGDMNTVLAVAALSLIFIGGCTGCGG